MKARNELQIGRLKIEFGWYSGEELIGLKIQIYQPMEISGLVIFSIQIAKLLFSID